MSLVEGHDVAEATVEGCVHGDVRPLRRSATGVANARPWGRLAPDPEKRVDVLPQVEICFAQQPLTYEYKQI